MVNSQKGRSCEFCDEEVELEDFPQHLRSHHKMACTGEDPQAQVKCMFCMEQMSEVDMFSHVFYGHNISGMFFSSAGGEEEGAETDRSSSKTVSVQTEDNPTRSPGVSADLQGNIELSEISDNNNEELLAVSASEESHLELHSPEEQITPDCDEENLILLDDDESDFEMEGPLPLPEVCYGPSHTFKTDDPTDQPEDKAESEVSVVLIQNSNNPGETQPGVDVPEPEVTLINVAKGKEKDLVPGPVKKVRFSDVTNYYPIRKRGKLKRGARKLEPLILGANTSLKYLKYWGTTNKPD